MSQDKFQLKTIGRADSLDGLFLLHSKVSVLNRSSVCSSISLNLPVSCNVSVNTWHNRLGHVSFSRLHLLKDQLKISLSDNKQHCTDPCLICPLAKQRRLSFQSHNHLSPHMFDLLHCDIWGPFSVSTYNGYRYFLTLVDDHSRFTWVYLLRNKSDVLTIIPRFFQLIETQYSKVIKCFRSDNAPELKFTDFFAAKGVVHQFSCVARPEQNSVVERKHQHLLNVARALYFQSRIPISFWGECILTATYLINRTPTPLLSNNSPFSVLSQQVVDFSILRVFGCLCYASTLSTQRTKFDPRANPCVFLGYPPGIKGYKLYDIQNKRFLISRDVIFFEEVFPFHSVSTPTDVEDHFPDFVRPIPLNIGSDMGHFSDYTYDPLSCSSVGTSQSTNNLPSSPILSNDLAGLSPISSDTATDITIDPDITPTEVVLHPDIISIPPIRKATRSSHPPSYLKDFHCNLTSQKCTSPSLPRYPIENYLSYAHLSTPFKHFILNVSSVFEPQFYHQAIKFDHWRHAMNEELAAMERTHTWTVTSLPPGHQAIGNKWVYKVKYKADGNVDRFKARLVAKGFNQQEGLDFFETFSPIAKLVTVKILLSLAASYNWSLHQLDVNNAFLNGDLFEEVYMTLPLGYKHNHGVGPKGEPLVCKLNKSIYGLKQASRQWFTKFSQTLLSHQFTQSQSDYSLFTRGTGNTFVALLVYVDDIILTGPSLDSIKSVKQLLHSQFLLKDLGSLKYFLGLEISRTSTGIYLSQRKYCLQLLEDTGFLASKPTVLPMDPKSKLSSQGDLLSTEDSSTYRRIIGRLLYLQISRPDIAFTVHQLSQFIAKPRGPHLSAAHHLLRYLKGTPGQGILLKHSTSFQLKAFVDSDWGACLDTRRSITGFCIFMGDSMVSWRAKKQPTVSRSSAEAEYRALAAVTSEILWLHQLLKDFQVSVASPTLIYCDNQAAIYIASNPTFHERTKHIEIDCHFVRNKVADGTLKLFPIRSQHQLADIFTKPLSATSLFSLLGKMGVLNFHSSP